MKFAVKLYNCKEGNQTNKDLGIAAYTIIATNLFFTLIGLI